MSIASNPWLFKLKTWHQQVGPCDATGFIPCDVIQTWKATVKRENQEQKQFQEARTADCRNQHSPLQNKSWKNLSKIGIEPRTVGKARFKEVGQSHINLPVTISAIAAWTWIPFTCPNTSAGTRERLKGNVFPGPGCSCKGLCIFEKAHEWQWRCSTPHLVPYGMMDPYLGTHLLSSLFPPLASGFEWANISKVHHTVRINTFTMTKWVLGLAVNETIS